MGHLIIETDINLLKTDGQNPNEMNDLTFSALKQNITKYGFLFPVITNSEYIIADGEHRFLAAKELGFKTIPVIKLDIKEVDRRILRQVLNKLKGKHNEELDKLEYEKILQEISAEDFALYLPDDSISEVINNLNKSDYSEEDDKVDDVEEIKTDIKRGDIFKLGNHRLMCGDSTSENDVSILMNGNKADMIFTDPPYLMGFTGNVPSDGSKSFNAKYGAIKNDKMSKEEGDKFIFDIFNIIKNNVIGSYYVCFYRLGLDYIFRALDKHNNSYKSLIIWNKGNHTLSNSDYMSKYEPIIYGWFNEHNFYGDRSNFDIWDISRTPKNDLHPTMKPIELCSRGIINSSKSNGIVLDLFGGSGSTLIACENLNRNCYMMELDEKYCQVIINRWENLTGKRAEKIN